jgi:hypothetical protein
VVHFDGKDVLDYVLEFIGLQKAEYNNEVLFKCGLFRGEVIIQLPKVEEARCGGRTKFHGTSSMVLIYSLPLRQRKTLLVKHYVFWRQS